MPAIPSSSNPNAFGAFAEGLAGGYDWASDQQRKRQENEARQRALEGQQEIEDIFGELNAPTQVEMPSAISTRDRHPGTVGVEKVKAASPARVRTREDWDRVTNRLASAYAKVDPSKAMGAFQEVQQVQQLHIANAAQAALSRMSIGDASGAAKALSQAGSFFPDGNTWEVISAADGSLRLKVTDEESGEVVSESVVTPEQIQQTASALLDPKQFNQSLLDSQRDRAKHKDAIELLGLDFVNDEKLFGLKASLERELQNKQNDFRERLQKAELEFRGAEGVSDRAVRLQAAAIGEVGADRRQTADLAAREQMNTDDNATRLQVQAIEMDVRRKIAVDEAIAAGAKAARATLDDTMKEAAKFAQGMVDPSKEGAFVPELEGIPAHVLSGKAMDVASANADSLAGKPAIAAAMAKDMVVFERALTEISRRAETASTPQARQALRDEQANLIKSTLNPEYITDKDGEEVMYVSLNGRQVKAPLQLEVLLMSAVAASQQSADQDAQPGNAIGEFHPSPWTAMPPSDPDQRRGPSSALGGGPPVTGSDSLRYSPAIPLR